MKLIFTFFLLLPVQALAIDVCLLDAGEKHPHEIGLRRVFEKNVNKKCPDCRLHSFPIYDQHGEQEPELVVRQLRQAAGRCQLIHLSWNREGMGKWKPAIEEANKIIASGIPIVAAGGTPEEYEVGAPLSRSVMGRVKDVVLIGELDAKKKLVIGAYHGPELLTALRPPKGKKGSSYSAMLFTARWAPIFRQKKPADWLAQFRERKAKSKSLWPTLEELFAKNPPKTSAQTKKK